MREQEAGCEHSCPPPTGLIVRMHGGDEALGDLACWLHFPPRVVTLMQIIWLQV